MIIVNKLETDSAFKDKYINFLSSGGSDYPLNILKKLGITLNEETMKNAFSIYEEYLELLEKE